MLRRFQGGQSRGLTVALALSLSLHVLLGAGFVLLRPLEQADGRPEQKFLEVSLAPREDPTFFTELPEDRADAAPEQADFLSNVDSRARDRTPGGDDRLPSSEGAAPVPQVELVHGEPATPTPPAEPADAAEPAETPREETPDPFPAPESLRERFASRSDNFRPQPVGLSDIAQEALANPSGNAILPGDITLSTTAWEYAPWLQHFRRSVESHWHPPVAYRMGLIDGQLTVRVEIARSGELVDLSVLRQDVGHRSLSEAVTYALRAGARYRSLPAHFPEESLVLWITFVYPTVRPR
jgi:hypothetical protein